MKLEADLNSFFEPYLKNYNVYFKDTLKSDVSLLQNVIDYVILGKGKQIRPLTVFASANAYGQINDVTFKGALLIELLHTASLIHDDVVDDSMQRRGSSSVNYLWNNKISILVGDYLFSRCLGLLADTNSLEYVKQLAWCAEMITQGEILQLEKSKTLDITEDEYFKIIKMKTASLFSLCCAFGVMSIGSDIESVDRMKNFGEIVGMIFQIRDDMLDMQTDNEAGKPFGVDIKEKKLTLPVIYALDKASKIEKDEILSILAKQELGNDDILKIITFAKSKGCIEYVDSVVEKMTEKGLKLLNGLDHNKKIYLECLINSASNRNK